MADVAEVQSSQWWDVVGKLRELGSQIDAVINKLQGQQSDAARDPALAGEYATIMSRAASLRDTTRDYLAKADAVIQWTRGAGAWIADAVGLNSLGVIPVIIGVGAITLAIAAGTKFLADAWALSKRIDEQHRLEGRGLSPQDAARTVQGYTGDSAGSMLTRIVLPVGGGIAALLLLRWYMANRRG